MSAVQSCSDAEETAVLFEDNTAGFSRINARRVLVASGLVTTLLIAAVVVVAASPTAGSFGLAKANGVVGLSLASCKDFAQTEFESFASLLRRYKDQCPTDLSQNSQNKADASPECRKHLETYWQVEHGTSADPSDVHCHTPGLGMKCTVLQEFAGMTFTNSKCYPSQCTPVEINKTGIPVLEEDGLCSAKIGCLVKLSCKGHEPVEVDAKTAKTLDDTLKGHHEPIQIRIVNRLRNAACGSSIMMSVSIILASSVWNWILG